jgi:hypothetical protein
MAEDELVRHLQTGARSREGVASPSTFHRARLGRVRDALGAARQLTRRDALGAARQPSRRDALSAAREQYGATRSARSTIDTVRSASDRSARAQRDA